MGFFTGLFLKIRAVLSSPTPPLARKLCLTGGPPSRFHLFRNSALAGGSASRFSLFRNSAGGPTAGLFPRFYSRRPGGKSKTKALEKKAMQKKFNCNICNNEIDKKFDSPHAMSEHFRDRHPEIFALNHKCKCGIHFINEETLAAHKKNDCLLSEDHSITAFRKRLTIEYRAHLHEKRFPPCTTKALGVFVLAKELDFSSMGQTYLPCVEHAAGIRFLDAKISERVHLLFPPEDDLHLTLEEVDKDAVSLGSDTLMKVIALQLPSVYENPNGDWDFSSVKCKVDLEEKVVGIVSGGKTTKRLVRRFSEHNAKIVTVDGAKWEEDIDSIISCCDVLVVCDTRFLMDEEEIKRLKHGVIVVSDTKATWDMKAVLEATKSGQIAGFAFYCSEHRDCPVLVVSDDYEAEFLV